MTMERPDLLAYQRAEHQVAKRHDSVARLFEYLILVTALTSIAIARDTFVLAGTLASLLLTIAWQTAAFLGRRSHSIAERARRAVILEAGLGISLTGKAYSDLFAAFTAKQKQVERHGDQEFYASDQPKGPKRLAEILEESAFWSKHLFQATARAAWWRLGVAGVISVTCLALLPLLRETSVAVLWATAICVVLTWLVTGSMGSGAVAYALAAREVDDIEARLAAAPATPEGILPILGDYNAVVQAAPTIPSAVYKRMRPRLNQLWTERHASQSTFRSSDP